MRSSDLLKCRWFTGIEREGPHPRTAFTCVASSRMPPAAKSSPKAKTAKKSRSAQPNAGKSQVIKKNSRTVRAVAEKVGKQTTLFPAGTIHNALPLALKGAVESSKLAQTAWVGITPLARNEWICWVQSAKFSETRAHRIEVAVDMLKAGKRRPCCWPGCSHRVRNGK
jgi:hypothetical protein